MYEYQKSSLFNPKMAFFIHLFWCFQGNHVLLLTRKLPYYEIYQLECQWASRL